MFYFKFLEKIALSGMSEHLKRIIIGFVIILTVIIPFILIALIGKFFGSIGILIGFIIFFTYVGGAAINSSIQEEKKRSR